MEERPPLEEFLKAFALRVGKDAPRGHFRIQEVEEKPQRRGGDMIRFHDAG